MSINQYHSGRKHTREKGVVLLTMSVAAVGLFAVMGLAVDIGRMYITKNEAQSFADAGAISAALKLDGSSAGITSVAQLVASNAKNQYNLGTSSFTAAQVTVQYSTASTGAAWVSDTAAQTTPANLMYAKVSVTPPVSLYFLPIVVPGTVTTVPATTVAGQVAQTSFSQGLFPFSPMTINAADPNFGYTAGLTYTLRFGSGGVTCSGETGNAAAYTAADNARGSSNHGYWSTLGNSNSIMSLQILNNLQGSSVTLGDALPVAPGNRQAEFADGGNPGAVPIRVSQDINTAATTYAAYKASGTGNGRRLVGVPVSDPLGTPANKVVGFAEFFLTNTYPLTGSENYCAEYVGPWTQDSITQGAGGPGAYKVRLVQ